MNGREMISLWSVGCSFFFPLTRIFEMARLVVTGLREEQTILISGGLEMNITNAFTSVYCVLGIIVRA